MLLATEEAREYLGSLAEEGLTVDLDRLRSLTDETRRRMAIRKLGGQQTWHSVIEAFVTSEFRSELTRLTQQMALAARAGDTAQATRILEVINNLVNQEKERRDDRILRFADPDIAGI